MRITEICMATHTINSRSKHLLFSEGTYIYACAKSESPNHVKIKDYTYDSGVFKGSIGHMIYLVYTFASLVS